MQFTSTWGIITSLNWTMHSTRQSIGSDNKRPEDIFPFPSVVLKNSCCQNLIRKRHIWKADRVSDSLLNSRHLMSNKIHN